MMILSPLPKTWIFDLDGTLLKHNGYKTDSGDVVIPEAKDFLNRLDVNDRVIILTARPLSSREQTETFLKQNGIRYDLILWDMPAGERILINDMKPSGLITAYAVNCPRDGFEGVEFTIDPTK